MDAETLLAHRQNTLLYSNVALPATLNLTGPLTPISAVDSSGLVRTKQCSKNDAATLKRQTLHILANLLFTKSKKNALKNAPTKKLLDTKDPKFKAFTCVVELFFQQYASVGRFHRASSHISAPRTDDALVKNCKNLLLGKLYSSCVTSPCSSGVLHTLFLAPVTHSLTPTFFPEVSNQGPSKRNKRSTDTMSFERFSVRTARDVVTARIANKVETEQRANRATTRHEPAVEVKPKKTQADFIEEDLAFLEDQYKGVACAGEFRMENSCPGNCGLLHFLPATGSTDAGEDTPTTPIRSGGDIGEAKTVTATVETGEEEEQQQQEDATSDIPASPLSNWSTLINWSSPRGRRHTTLNETRLRDSLLHDIALNLETLNYHRNMYNKCLARGKKLQQQLSSLQRRSPSPRAA